MANYRNTMNPRFRLSRPSSSLTARKLTKWLIGNSSTSDVTVAMGAGAVAQVTQFSLTETDFQGTNVRVPGLSKLDLTFSIFPTTTGSMDIDVFVLRHPTATAVPTLTGAVNWSDLLKGIQVLGYKRFALGLTTIPRIARIPVRSFPNLGLSDQITLVQVRRSHLPCTAELQFRLIPKFRV